MPNKYWTTSKLDTRIKTTIQVARSIVYRSFDRNSDPSRLYGSCLQLHMMLFELYLFSHLFPLLIFWQLEEKCKHIDLAVCRLYCRGIVVTLKKSLHITVWHVMSECTSCVIHACGSTTVPKSKEASTMNSRQLVFNFCAMTKKTDCFPTLTPSK